MLGNHIFFHKCTTHDASGGIISPAALCITVAWTRCALCAADAVSRAAVLRHRLGLWHLLLCCCATWRGRWIKKTFKREIHRKRQCSDSWRKQWLALNVTFCDSDLSEWQKLLSPESIVTLSDIDNIYEFSFFVCVFVLFFALGVLVRLYSFCALISFRIASVAADWKVC